MSRKFGQPAAVIAGLSKASGEYVGVIDADLQDPPEILYKMYQKILLYAAYFKYQKILQNATLYLNFKSGNSNLIN